MPGQFEEELYVLLYENVYGRAPAIPPATAAALDAPPDRVTLPAPAPAAPHPPESAFRFDSFVAFGGDYQPAAGEGEDEWMGELFAGVPADYEVDAAAEAERQLVADADLFGEQDVETQSDTASSTDTDEELFRSFTNLNDELPSTHTNSADTGAKAQEKPAPQTAEELLGPKPPFGPVYHAQSQGSIPSVDTGSKAQDKPAPKTASDLTGMRLPCAPVQHAESKPTPSTDRAAEALDTPLQMPAPEHVEELLPDFEDVPADVDVVDAPAFNNGLALVVSPAPMTPKGINADIDPALQDEPSVEAQAEAFLAKMAAKNNPAVPDNVSIPQNNIWDGQGMQHQINGMFHSSSAGNMTMQQGNINGMAAQACMNPQIPTLNNPTQHTGHMCMQNYDNINGMGAQGRTNHQVPVANTLNLPLRPAANVYMPNQSAINGMGNTIVMNAQVPHAYAAGFNPALHPHMPMLNQASMQPHFGTQPQAQNFAQPGAQVGNHTSPNGHIYQQGQPLMLNVSAQHQAPQFSGEAESATTPNGAWYTKAQAPALNAPSQMAPTTLPPFVNGMAQSPPAASLEHYRRFPKRPNSKPGCPYLFNCLNCGAFMRIFGVRCANCQNKRMPPPVFETRWCVVGDCNDLLSFGTGRILCDKHHDDSPQYTKAEHDQLEAEGICNNCYKVDAENGVTCKTCRTFKNGNYKARNEEAKSQGICITCREVNTSDCNKCDACREKDNVKRRKRPSPEKDNGGRGKRPRKA